jgi:hypothetical protein
MKPNIRIQIAQVNTYRRRRIHLASSRARARAQEAAWVRWFGRYSDAELVKAFR